MQEANRGTDAAARQPETVRQGTTGDLDERTRVGVMNVFDDGPSAQVSLWSPETQAGAAGHGPLTLTVRRGSIVAWGGRFYRVTEVRPAAGDERGAVTFDRRPVELQGTTLQPDSYALPVGGRGTLHNHSVELVGVEERSGKRVARVDVWPGGQAKEDAEKNSRLSRSEVAAGDVLKIGERRLSVRSVVAPRPEQGLAGLVEIDLKPQP